MKVKRTLLSLLVICLAIPTFSQQIGNGEVIEVTSLDRSLPSGAYLRGFYSLNYPPTLYKGSFMISAQKQATSFQLRTSFQNNTLHPGMVADRMYYRIMETGQEVNDWIEIATCKANTFTENQIINAKVGIKNANPAYDLDVTGTGRFTNNVLMNGKVGIKITNPAYELDVNGKGCFRDNLFTIGKLGVKNGAPTYDLDVNGTGRFTNNLLITGKVGIKTTNPTYDLDVNGVIRGKEVRVESGWADFVFDKDYKLPALDEVQAHIEQHKHLPGMPTAAEVKENGIGLSEATTLLVQKMEELTLYVIDLKKENERQSQRISDLEQLLNDKK